MYSMDGISEQNNGAVPDAGTLQANTNTDNPVIEPKAEESVGNDPRFAWDVSILAVPSDTLKRVTRERKYVIESIQNSVALLNTKEKDIKGAVERVLAKVQELRARLTEIGLEEKKYLDQCRARVGYLLRMKSPHAIKDMTYIEWNAGERFQLLLQEYIARRGYEKSLQCMLGHESMGEQEAAMLLDVDAFNEMQELAVSLERGCGCSVALAWCKDHQAKLKKLKSSLPFHLHVQEFLEVLFKHSDTCSWKERQRNAIEYAQTYLAPYASANALEFQQAAAALVLASPRLGSKATHFSPQDRWASLVRQMRREFFRLHGLPLTSPLEIHLQAGISALKTPLGMQTMDGERNPLGNPALHAIAETLPYSKRTVSKLVCPITGKIMEGSNAPMVLPNGYVYGEEAIKTGLMCLDEDEILSILQDDEYPIQCPITKEVFSSMDARRAYIV